MAKRIIEGENSLIQDIEREFYQAIYDEIKYIEISDSSQDSAAYDWL
jgi:hypothetical protein